MKDGITEGSLVLIKAIDDIPEHRFWVPEHFTATLVGHQSARSENRLTYSIYSAGISDEQKRAIVDAIPVPEGL